MKPSTKAYLNHMKDGLKQTVHGLAFVSPLVGAFTGFAVNFMGHWGSAALMGLWIGPIVAAGAVALLAVAEYGPKGALKKFGDLKPANFRETAVKGFKRGLQTFMSLLPGGMGSTFAAFGAVLLSPGVMVSPATLPSTLLFAPQFLIPAIAITLGAYVAGHMLGSKILRTVTRDPHLPTLPGATRAEKMGALLGRFMPYHEPGAPATFHRHPLSALAIGLGAVTFGVLTAGFTGWVLPMTMLGTFIGAAVTSPMQEEAAQRARGQLAGVTEGDGPVGATEGDSPYVGVTPGGPSNIVDFRLKDKFGRKQEQPEIQLPQPQIKLPQPRMRA